SPIFGTALQHDQIVVSGPLEQARAGHGSFTVPAHQRDPTGGNIVHVRERAELDVARARNVTGPELVALAYVDDCSVVDRVGGDQVDRGERKSGVLPRPKSTGELAVETL